MHHGLCNVKESTELLLIFSKNFCFTTFERQYLNLLMAMKQNFCDTSIELGRASGHRSNTSYAPRIKNIEILCFIQERKIQSTLDIGACYIEESLDIEDNLLLTEFFT